MPLGLKICFKAFHRERLNCKVFSKCSYCFVPIYYEKLFLFQTQYFIFSPLECFFVFFIFIFWNLKFTNFNQNNVLYIFFLCILYTFYFQFWEKIWMLKLFGFTLCDALIAHIGFVWVFLKHKDGGNTSISFNSRGFLKFFIDIKMAENLL